MAKAEQIPLVAYADFEKYLKVQTSSAMPLDRLAQTTHVHLLGFAMLYGLTGLLFALTGYWTWLRVGLAPLPLLAQVVEISFWWLARLDDPQGSMIARMIPPSAAVVGAALGLQILLTLFALFGRNGKVVLILLIAVVIGAGFDIKERIIDKHLESEKAPTAILDKK